MWNEIETNNITTKEGGVKDNKARDFDALAAV